MATDPGTTNSSYHGSGSNTSTVNISGPTTLSTPNHSVSTKHAPVYKEGTSCCCEPTTPAASLATGPASNDGTASVSNVGSGSEVNTVKTRVIVSATAHNPAI